MADQNEQAAENQEQELQPLTIHGQYIKDLSFEVPNSPGIYGRMMQEQPDVNVNVDVDAQKLTDTQFEVIVKIRADCKTKEDVAFICELAYGGIFEINVPQEHLEPMLLIECPRMLFPFARHIIANTTRDGSFPPMMLNPVDFAGMYRQRIEALAAEQEAAGETKQ
ncbi:Protein-export protein SecB [Candidatus Terasakiella magnetica]|uniref:Protein-export protein SecB n=1 Tax=Candidatus Terasakiella magnetica TaxID=1867952 RepID=A0A1C3RGA2_9PROT|nr:protein-export chaperone SecB [Candidatus Terasakiella magnetica]SCA56336.1 Protein-export protein SecB [Candidatus Terasakiella magnetica]